MVEPIVSIKPEKAKLDRAVELLDGLRNTLEAAMIDDEYAQFGEALNLLSEVKAEQDWLKVPTKPASFVMIPKG